MSEERSELRLSIIPQLLEVVKYNNARQMDSVALYEIGSVFFKKDGEQLPEEKEYVAGAITGLWEANLWQGEKKPVDFYVAKGIVEAIFESIGVTDRSRVSSSNHQQYASRTYSRSSIKW